MITRTYDETGCPHRDAIQFCPLYVAAHDAKCVGFTCLGKVHPDTQECEVSMGILGYFHAVESLRAVAPMLVAQCEFGKMKHDALAQVNRNMRANGIN